MTLLELTEILRPTQANHLTKDGAKYGFLMADATRVLGGLDVASKALLVLMSEGGGDAKPVVIDDDVDTLYFITDKQPPIVH